MTEEAYIGQRIRARRTEVGISIRELGRRTDLTASFLSQVELGQTNISISSLRRISEALEVSMLYFFTEVPDPNPVVRADNRPKISFTDPHVSYELLTPDRARKLEMLCGKLRPGSGNVARRLSISTEECIVVLSGTLEVGLESGEFVLNPGDSIYFNGDDLRKLACGSEEDVNWVSCITPPAFLNQTR
ncbi:MAG: XRE family transcriptional regulator [Chloroflexota bacterium]|nr:XRE family transcriptional regulator [Chloroflexota bacterium]